MKTRFVRFAYRHRSQLKRLIFIKRPVCLKLPDFRMYVRLDDWAVGARIAIKRSYEPHVTRLLRRLLKPGAIFIDIGANIGYYTLLAAAHVGSGGKVIAFEPSSDNCRILRMSLQANHYTNVTLYPYAVADVEELVGFGMDDSNGRISLDDPASAAYQVRAVTLDTFLKDEPQIDIIKMDIEGAEGRALYGMRNIIRRHRPIMVTEFSPRGLSIASNISSEEYLNQLRDLGYQITAIPHGGSLSATPQSNEQILEYFARISGADHLDLLARPIL
jgi:FkbM family methyltransferase